MGILFWQGFSDLRIFGCVWQLRKCKNTQEIKKIEDLKKIIFFIFLINFSRLVFWSDMAFFVVIEMLMWPFEC